MESAESQTITTVKGKDADLVTIVMICDTV